MISNHLLAQINNPALRNPNSQSDPAFISTVIQNIFGIFTVVGILYFVWHFIFAGYHWIASAGDAKKIEEAKNEITFSMVGLGVVFIVFAVLKLIGTILGIQGLDTFQISLPTL